MQVQSPPPHLLHNKWNMWAHLPQDKNWTPQSYKFMSKFETVEDVIVSMHMLPEQFISQCMIFITKDGILPIWEDEQNKNGGAFSYKVSNKNIDTVWKELAYSVSGETVATNTHLMKNITGISVSPKNNFCVVKIWSKTCDNQNPGEIISCIKGLNVKGCLFKKHDCGK